MKRYRFRDLSVGTREIFEVQLSDADLEGFCALTGDVNPLHFDLSYARTKGFRDRVVHGMLTGSLISRLAGMHLPGELCFLQTVHLDFVAPVFPGDLLKVEGVVAHLSEAFQQVTVKSKIHNQCDLLVCRAMYKATFMV